MSAQISSFRQCKAAKDSKALEQIHRDMRDKALDMLQMLETCVFTAPIANAVASHEFKYETARRNLERTVAREEAALASLKERP